uniref:Secreted protein n=1 Tax=Ixodes ricinus TaxID=34613 RepID=A0A6B0UE53_IXORI
MVRRSPALGGHAHVLLLLGHGGRAHDGAGGPRAPPAPSPRGGLPPARHSKHLRVAGVFLVLHVVDRPLQHVDVVGRVALHVTLGWMRVSGLLLLLLLLRRALQLRAR